MAEKKITKLCSKSKDTKNKVCFKEDGVEKRGYLSYLTHDEVKELGNPKQVRVTIEKVK